jgi:hypothetical protein
VHAHRERCVKDSKSSGKTIKLKRKYAIRKFSYTKQSLNHVFVNALCASASALCACACPWSAALRNHRAASSSFCATPRPVASLNPRVCCAPASFALGCSARTRSLGQLPCETTAPLPRRSAPSRGPEKTCALGCSVPPRPLGQLPCDTTAPPPCRFAPLRGPRKTCTLGCSVPPRALGQLPCDTTAPPPRRFAPSRGL